MIAHVVFPERRPRALGAFDYAIPTLLEKKVLQGCGVIAQFRSQHKLGIVLGLSNSTKIHAKKIKEILNVVAPSPLITHSQIALIDWLADKTGSSLATTLSAFLPEKPVRIAYTLTTQKKLVKKKSKNTNPKLHVFDTYEALNKFCKPLIKNKNSVSLFIVPDNFHMKLLLQIFPDAITYSGKLSKKEKFKTWERVYHTSEAIVIGTRNALYLPYHKLDSIYIIREESHVFLKQEQHPDYDAFSLARKAADVYVANLNVLSLAPRITTYYQCNNNIFLHASEQYPKITLIDKRVLADKHQSTILPQDLLTYIHQTPGMHVMLYNRKGRFRYFNCEDCEWQAVCDECGAGFIQEDEIRGLISCRICKHKQQLPLRCPSCLSTRIRSSGAGIKYYADKISNEFPGKKVVHSYKESGSLADIVDADIVIGTQYMLSFLPWHRIASITVADIDTVLNAPDFRAHEWALQRLRHIAALMPSRSQCFILTRTPNHAVYRTCITRDIQAWYALEIDVRKKLSYPPFSHLVIMKSTLASNSDRIAAIDALYAAISDQERLLRCTITALTVPPEHERTARGWTAVVHLRIPKIIADISPLLRTLAGNHWSWQENPLDLYS